MVTAHTDPTEPARPTRARFVLALWLCGLTAILYLDRVCMSQAVAPIQKAFGLSNTDMSYVMMAFTVAYGLFEIPAGRMGDRSGSRAVLTRIVAWWSVFTALTGATWGFASLLVVRFLFGAGEAGAFPNAIRVIARWYPLHERGRVQGLMLAAAQLGGVMAPVCTAWLIDVIGWRWAFPLFGLVGIAWAVGFWKWFRDDPAKHPQVNAAELAVIRDDQPPPAAAPGPVPWRAALTNRGVLTLCLAVVCGAFYTYFFYSWFPKYLTAARGVDNYTSGALASVVLAGSAVGMLLGGWASDRITKRAANPINARRWLCAGCFLVSAVCLWVGIRCDQPMALAALWGLSFCAMHVTMPNWWSVVVPQCGRHVGALSGLMNGAGVIGALASQWFVGAWSDFMAGAVYRRREQWDDLFDVYAAALVVAAGAWWFYSYRPLPDHPPP